jgi:hypothetical protein
MNKTHSHFISCESRSFGSTRVCLTLAKTDSEAAWQRRNQEKTIASDLNRRPLAILSLTRRHARRGCAMLQSSEPKLHSCSAV